MSLIRWTPNWDPFAEMEEMMNRLPVQWKNNTPGNGPTFIPAVDMYETKDAVVVETPLAGMRPEDVSVQVENGILTISGESKKEREVEEKNYYRKEVRSGSFYRQVPLPVEVKDDAIVAEFADGILQVTCPKVAPVEAKKIQVEVKKKLKE
ncbi:MAG: Hsp20/alpha crystallin family protein [Candidatus Magasanikbacteria bacterium]|jgi:HSP20 family protein|nr:Hsp20/alpha crystallin family protein [Candidatus Magasanikbacteria bacterium]